MPGRRERASGSEPADSCVKQASERKLSMLRAVLCRISVVPKGIVNASRACAGYTRMGASGQAEPLPSHKFGPHDVVALRPSKGDTTGDPLAEGLVYRVKVTSRLPHAREANLHVAM